MKPIFSLAMIALASVVGAQTFTDRGATVLNGVSLNNARSASLADTDNDGDLDLLFQGGSNALKFYRNNFQETGELGYTDISETGGIEGSDIVGWSAAWADYDGDGLVDLFIGQSNNAGASTGDVFRNSPTGFTNVSDSTIPDPGFHQNVVWIDMDNDGDLDLMIGMEGPDRHELYLQNDDGTFTAVGAEVGIQVDFGTKGYGLAVGDADGDGDYDMYLSTCRSRGDIRNNFFENRLVPDGVLSFVDIADDNGTQFMDNSYHSEFIDFDNDLDLDLWMIGADSKETKIWRNDGNGVWTDVATLLEGNAVLPHPGGDFNGGLAIDYDNDGDLDLFAHDHLPANGQDEARALFRNDGNWVFVDVTDEEGLGAACEYAYDSAWGDLDLDGDMDLIAPTGNGFPERVFISNASNNGNHWLQVVLRDPTGKNTRAIGAQVYVTANGTTWRRDAHTNAGTFNQSDTPVHFGLGTATAIEKIEVIWPDKTTIVFEDVDSDQYFTIVKAPQVPAEAIGIF